MLRENIREHLGLQDKNVVVNPVTGHVVVKVSLSSLSGLCWIFQHASCLRTRDLRPSTGKVSLDKGMCIPELHEMVFIFS